MAVANFGGNRSCSYLSSAIEIHTYKTEILYKTCYSPKGHPLTMFPLVQKVYSLRILHVIYDLVCIDGMPNTTHETNDKCPGPAI